MYSNEQKFSQAFIRCCKMQDKKSIVQRIESPETGVGIPDIYIRSALHELWIELKNAPYNSIHDAAWKIKWRPGQQAWMYRYYKLSACPCYTLVALSDGFIFIPMIRMFRSDIVLRTEATVIEKLHNVWDMLIKEQ